MTLALRVAARFQQRLADQAPGARQHAKKLTKPINNPKGIQRDIVRNNGAELDVHDDTVTPNRRDIQPKDVFNLTPNHGGVLNVAETGHGLEKAIDKQVPKDKGYGTVYNLSQYLLWTEGGAGNKS